MFKRTLPVLLIFTLLALCMSACKEEVSVDDPTMLELPGIKWNSTPEEVKSALKLTEEQILWDQEEDTNGEDNAAWSLCITGVSLFGKKLLMGQFNFTRYKDYENFGLESVRLYYHNETDMTVVRNNLTDIYGVGCTGVGIIKYRITGGKLKSYNESLISTTRYEDPAEDVAQCWTSTAKYEDVLPSNVQEKILTMCSDADDATEYLEKQPAVTLACTNSAAEGTYDAQYVSRNCVVFAANEYVAYMQLVDK